MILFVSYDDYANFAYHQCESLKSVGIDARCVKLVKHPFGYDKEAEILSLTEVCKLIYIADIVIIMHSALIFVDELRKYKKKVVVWHTGSAYRANPVTYNRTFDPLVYLTLTDQCEFMSLGAKNLHYVAATINVDTYPSFGHHPEIPYKVGHFPSNPEVKGTTQILQMIYNLDPSTFVLDYSLEKVNHAAQLKRMNDCDIYIELFKPELRGKPYGCFGVTAFEAAAAGKIVITQNLNEHVYKDAYGVCELVITNTVEDFKNKLQVLLRTKNICEMQTDTYNWIINNHGYKANAERLKKLLSI